VTGKRDSAIAGRPIEGGIFVAVVGPSGVGKDTVINHARKQLAGEAAVLFVRRIITRANEGAGEDHDTLTKEEFDRRKRRGAFSLAWEAHGLRYGLPAATDEAIRRGKVAVANLSRGAIASLRKRYANVKVVQVTASPGILAARLAARGRESEDEIRDRIARNADFGLAIPDAVTIANEGRADDAGELLVALIRQSIREIAGEP
jgi:ribose 1,5-bisphosphokinase